jgi:hypothetical protein
MGPAVVAYQLLQPVKTATYEHNLRALILAARRGPQPSSRFVPRGDSPLARDEADGPRATCSGEVTPDPLSPRKGLGVPDYEPHHPPRRRLATPSTDGPGSVGRKTE